VGGSLAGCWLRNRGVAPHPHHVARAPYGKENISNAERKEICRLFLAGCAACAMSA